MDQGSTDTVTNQQFEKFETSVEADANDARDGDLEALSRLYERYADRLHRWLVSKASGNIHIAEDVAGDTWVRVASSIGGYTCKGGGFPAWLFTIAGRQLADHYRDASTRHEHISSDLLGTLVELRGDVTPGPEGHALAREAKRRIARAVEQLPDAQRRVVILHHWVGLTFPETAAVMASTPDAVRMQHRRAMRRLDPLLGGYSPRHFDVDAFLAIGGSDRAAEPA